MLYSAVPQEGVQAVRLASKNRTVEIVTHPDTSTDREIVLWEDVLVVFPDALYLQHGAKALPFLKGSNFKTLDPLRIAAVPGVVLDVVVKGQSSGEDIAPPQETPQQLNTVSSPSVRRNPVYGLVEHALENYTHIEIPKTSAPGLQLISDNNKDDSDNSTKVQQPNNNRTLRGPQLSPEDVQQSIEEANLDDGMDQFRPGDADGLSDDELEAWYEQENAEVQFNTGVQFYHGHGVPQNRATAMEWFLKAANQGLSEAQYQVGLLYGSGRGVLQNHLRAAYWFLKAAEQGHVSAQVNVGLMYERGEGVAQDYSKAMDWYLKAADQGHALAQKNIGYLYNEGLGVPQDYKAAMHWYLKAVQLGLVEAQVNIALLYENGRGVSRDYSKAFEWFLKAAEQGELDAQVCIGSMYEDGRGVSQDYSAASHWYSKAAQRDYADAQTRLGGLHYRGLGVPQNYSTAIGWFFKAANQQHPTAQYLIGLLYMNGHGVPQDNKAAADWYLNASNQGHADAQNGIGFLYEKGYGVSQDYSKAAEWYLKAAEQGHVQAQYSIGCLYDEGRGVAKNHELAMEWYRTAAAQGHQDAIKVKDSPQEPVQAVRPVHKNNLNPTTPAAVAHVAIHIDTSSGKSIVLWDDVLQAFKDALYVRHGTRILSFIKGTDFKNLDPLRFIAIADTILEIVVDGQFTLTESVPPQSALQRIANQAARLPKYNPIERLPPTHAPQSPGNHTNRILHNQSTPFRHIQPRIPTKADARNVINRLATHVDLKALQEKGEGNPQDFATALGCYLKAVHLGHAHAQISVGDLYAHGQGVEQDSSRACQWYLLAADQGNVEARSKIEQLTSGDFSQSATLHATTSNEVAKGALVESTVDTIQDRSLELPLATPLEIPPQDIVEERSTVEPISDDSLRQVALRDKNETSGENPQASSEQEDVQAQFDKGLKYYRGQGVPQNFATAMDWYLKAAEQGHAQAQRSVGYMYDKGEGVPQSSSEAANWYLKAAKGGDAQAQHNIGSMYDEGRGVPQDDSKAAKWYLRAAMRGHSSAQGSMGVKYEEGGGVSIDKPTVVEWCQKAVDQGEQYAIRKLMKNETQGVQAVRLASKNRTVEIVTHPDTSTGKEIVLWEDVLVVFQDALYLQHGVKALPFLKGNNFKT
ncbi:hypothetical protein BGX29_000914, partial [Mortierella sp. GBA35]